MLFRDSESLDNGRYKGDEEKRMALVRESSKGSPYPAAD